MNDKPSPFEENADLMHELRMHLNTLIGFAEMLLDEAENGELAPARGRLQQVSVFGRQLLSDVEEDRYSPSRSTTPEKILLVIRHVMEKTQKGSNTRTLADLEKMAGAIEHFMDLSRKIKLEDSFAGTKVKGSLSVAQQDLNPIEPAKVLVVDDNSENRELLLRHLERRGGLVTSAENGQEALGLLSREYFDLVLLDIRMPEMDGFEVLKRLKESEALREIPVILVSALYDTESVVKGIRMGAEDYFLKPFNSILLQARIDACLEKRRLRLVNRALELRNIKEEASFVTASPAMQRVMERVKAVSWVPVNVLILGENGTGKEMIARAIHMASGRKSGPFVAVNCAAVPATLMESEFFGYEKGAFTGASATRGGRFEEANGGTLLLDEVADMPLELQPKLLRAIQEGEGHRLGGKKPVSYDFRLISATNKDIHDEVAEGRFRQDLFYRIFSVEIIIPPLRERKEDIGRLTRFFLDKVTRRFSKNILGIAPDVLDLFEEYPWPGNIRQLQHEVERLVALAPEGAIAELIHCSRDLQDWKAKERKIGSTQGSGALSQKVRELEILCIEDVLREVGGNKAAAAKRLGISRQGLDQKIKRYGVGLPVK